MKTSALVIKQTGISFAKNILTLLTFLILNVIFIIPIAQFLLRTFSAAFN